jgi:hypothetical protein
VQLGRTLGGRQNEAMHVADQGSDRSFSCVVVPNWQEQLGNEEYAQLNWLATVL